MNEMEALRIEEELQKQKMVGQTCHNFNRHSNDSGMVDIELLKPSDPGQNRLSAPECGLKKTALSNSLIDLESQNRRNSGGSLDSGMVSFCVFSDSFLSKLITLIRETKSVFISIILIQLCFVLLSTSYLLVNVFSVVR